MNWVWFIGGTWLALGLGLAVLIGRSIRFATLEEDGNSGSDMDASSVVPPPAPVPVAERHNLLEGRQISSPTGPTPSPLTAGCVSPTQRVPAEHEQGVL